MQRCETIHALRAQIKAWKQTNQTIAFVPTMGNLHQGHLSLVDKAKETADKVVVSVFVNPLQFDDKNDLSAYPRTLDNDIKVLTDIDCDLIFTPSVEVMYPQGMKQHTVITVPGTDDKLCGKNRPGHFDGVATVVSKLLNMVQADIAVFGEKDYQQLQLIKKLVIDLNIPVEIIGATTYREANGLAMSSRNQYLTEAEREQAGAVFQILSDIKKQLENGKHDFEQLQQFGLAQLQRHGFDPEYVEIRNADNLMLAHDSDKSLRILTAARLGKARLIDNIACHLA